MTKWIDFKLLKQQLSFDQVLTHYGIKTIKDGDAHVKANCPFHEDKRPSLGVDLNRKIWQCFACKTSGNILDFITRMEGHDPAAHGAIRKGAEIAVEIMSVDLQTHVGTRGVKPEKQVRAKPAEPPKEKQEDSTAEADDNPIYDGPENTPLSFELKLEASHPFLKEKGFKRSTYDAFGIGYCKRGMMKGRICIPLRRADGELVGYAGRWADKERPDDTPRWLYPPKFNPDCFLFNWFRLAPDPPEHVVISGTYWDALSNHETGISSIAVPGFDITNAHASLLAESGVQSVTLTGDRVPSSALDQLAVYMFVRREN